MTVAQYQRARREYTLLGITAVIESMLSNDFADFYGTTFKEFVAIIEKGAYYHFQLDGDRQNVSATFLNRANTGVVDLEKEFAKMDQLVSDYDVFMQAPASQYTLQTILNFYDFYHKIILVDYACMDSMDVIQILRPDLRPGYEKLFHKIRLRGETVYKRGETEFIPRFANWFAKKVAPLYSGEQIQYVLCAEMRDFVKNKIPLPTPAELDERKKLCYIRQWPGLHVEIFTGEIAREKIAKKGLTVHDQISTDIKELKGVVAFAGHALGRVCVVNTRADMEKFKDGDVIVASMTDPSYLPIMKRASAFVTDEGGVLCHAAIVARELKKPCIIGTKIATQIFKDGDMIEINAAIGTVKKLS